MMTGLKRHFLLAAALCAGAGGAALGQAIYSNIPSTLAGNYPSLGYQATQTAEFGDRVTFAGSNRSLAAVTVTMSSWAHSEDYGFGVSYTHPLTLNIYDAGAGYYPGPLLGTVTTNATIPYRPVGWGFNGIAFNVTFDFSSLHLTLPNTVVYGLAFNTETWGANPIGVDGPYDSLNFALNTGAGGGVTAGSNPDLDDVFWNTSTAGWYSDGGAAGVGIFRRDTAWTGLTPMAQFATTAVSLTPESSCVHDNARTIVVDVNMDAVPDAVVGGQFFLAYDSSLLTLVSAEPGDAPFTQQVFSNTSTPGQIDYAVGVPGGGPGTTAPTTMARLTFTAANDVCATAANLVTFRPHSPPSRLTDNTGNPITAALHDCPSIRIDSTPPGITCPPDVTTNADAGGCTYSILGPGWSVFGDASLHDNIAELPSSASLPNQYSGALYLPSAPLTLNQLTTLSADYAMLNGCFGGGAPRFSLGIDVDGDNISDGHLWFYLGTPGSWNDCPPLNVWTNTGNVVTSPLASVDASQLAAQGGAYGQTWAQAVAALGTYHVVSVAFVIDADWIGHDQDIAIDNMTVNSNVQTFTFAGPGSSDNCTATPAISSSRSDHLGLTDPYPTGTTTVTWTATDSCGNQASCDQHVTVNASNTMFATVQLENAQGAGPPGGPYADFDRCITFGLPTGGCTTFVNQVMHFNGATGIASGPVDIPCGSYDCITARDQRHTLRRTAEADHFGINGAQYVADFTGTSPVTGKQLIGGNLNDDGVIDILDFGAMVGQYGHSVGASTTCSTPYPHADISGNGTVFTEDFTYIQIHFLEVNEPDCCGGERPMGLPSVSIGTLVAMGHPEMVAADLNNDGWVDQTDMAIFANGGMPLCGSADFDCDGDIGTDADIESFFACLAGNCPASPCTSTADFNGDGDIGTDADIESFFRVLAGGRC